MSKSCEVERLKEVWPGVLVNVQLAIDLYRKVQADPEARAALEGEFDERTLQTLNSLCDVGGYLPCIKSILEGPLSHLSLFQREEKMPRGERDELPRGERDELPRSERDELPELPEV